jgi:transposase
MTATHTTQVTAPTVRLHLAFELGWSDWVLAFTVGHGQAPRLRTIRARDLEALQAEIAKAKLRFGLSADTPVLSCYEAGRDGFWLHRYLTAQGIRNLIVDSASIEVKRRKCRAKTDRIDAGKLVSMLIRYSNGETKVWSVVRVPSVAEEDQRQLGRELLALKDEQTQHINRLKALVASQGLEIKVDEKLLENLAALRLWDQTTLGEARQQQLQREFARWQLVHRQILDLQAQRRQRICREETPAVEQVRSLLGLRGIGLNGAWLLVRELFGWRKIRNRRELAALVGLTPMPYQSGDSAREQGISKAGNRRLRRMLVELAWCWVRWQPESALSRWYAARFGPGRGARKVGIVAVARKLLVALWRYLERGEVPEGARLCDWRDKLSAPKKKVMAAVAET